MRFNRGQLLGIGATLVGFIIIALAGINLASQITRPGADAGNLILGALLTLAFAVPFLGYGMFAYALHAQDEPEPEESDVAIQRRIVEFVNAHGMTTFPTLAEELNLDEQRIRDLVLDLLQLRIFGGFVDWDQGILYARNAAQLNDSNQPPTF